MQKEARQWKHLKEWGRHCMNKQVVIIGAGGHGKVIADIVQKSGDRVLGFLDDNTALPEKIEGIPVLGCADDYIKYPDAEFIIAIGNAAMRRQIAEQLNGVRWHTAVHPCAVISSMGVKIGEGSVVMANAVINPGASIGRHCIVNTASVIEHDDVIADYVHISVGAKLGGTVSVGEQTWVGIGAVVSNNVSVYNRCIIGAGAVVVKDIKESGTYVGVPARKIK